ncbi:MAG TPA: hypothetical protein VF621_03645 [Pyrinomonadaceae bacterium]
MAVYRRLRERGPVDPMWFAISLNILGISVSYKGDAPAGDTLLLEALEVGANLGGEDRGLIAVIYSNLRSFTTLKGEHARAELIFSAEKMTI